MYVWIGRNGVRAAALSSWVYVTWPKYFIEPSWMSLDLIKRMRQRSKMSKMTLSVTVFPFVLMNKGWVLGNQTLVSIFIERAPHSCLPVVQPFFILLPVFFFFFFSLFVMMLVCGHVFVCKVKDWSKCLLLLSSSGPFLWSRCCLLQVTHLQYSLYLKQY